MHKNRHIGELWGNLGPVGPQEVIFFFLVTKIVALISHMSIKSSHKGSKTNIHVRMCLTTEDIIKKHFSLVTFLCISLLIPVLLFFVHTIILFL